MFEMNDVQRGLFEKLTALQKEISLNSISGMNDIDAYKASSGKAKTVRAMETSVSQIMRNHEVDAFIKSMANDIVNPAIMGRQEMMEELSNIARTNSHDLIEWGYRDVETFDEDSEEYKITQQSFWTLRGSDDINPEHMKAIEEVSVGKEGLKFKRTSKLAAMKRLAELGGYEAPKKVETKTATLDIPADATPEDAAKAYHELMSL